MSVLSETIAHMHLWHVQMPVVTRRDHGIGTVADKVDMVIVELVSESGVSGFGEASPWSVFTGTAEASFAALDRYIRPFVIGAPVATRQQIMRQAQQCVVHCTEAKAALDTALLDLTGRLLGVPVSTLLGGRVRDTIPLSVSLANPDFDAERQLMDRLTGDGVGLVKFKTGFKTREFDLMRLEATRSQYPDFDIRVDYNQGLEPTDALRQLRDVEAFDVTFIEQPVSSRVPRIMQQLTASLDTPVLADETVFNAEDMLQAVEERLCRAVSIKIMKSGGLAAAQQVAGIAEAAGMAAYGGDMFETGIAHLAGAHMIAATPNITLGCEFYHATYYLKEDLLATPFPVVDGRVNVPTGPGLGIEVDTDKVNHYAIHKV